MPVLNRCLKALQAGVEWEAFRELKRRACNLRTPTDPPCGPPPGAFVTKTCLYTIDPRASANYAGILVS